MSELTDSLDLTPLNDDPELESAAAHELVNAERRKLFEAIREVIKECKPTRPESLEGALVLHMMVSFKANARWCKEKGLSDMYRGRLESITKRLLTAAYMELQ